MVVVIHSLGPYNIHDGVWLPQHGVKHNHYGIMVLRRHGLGVGNSIAGNWVHLGLNMPRTFWVVSHHKHYAVGTLYKDLLCFMKGLLAVEM